MLFFIAVRQRKPQHEQTPKNDRSITTTNLVGLHWQFPTRDNISPSGCKQPHRTGPDKGGFRKLIGLNWS